MISFRPHTQEDVSLRVRWLNNRKAILYALDDPNHVTTTEEQNQWFNDYEEKLKSGKKSFFTILFDNRPVGFMGLSNIIQTTKSADVFILIGEDKYRGRGTGKEAMRYLINYAYGELGLDCLQLEVKKLNLSAINLYLSLGFEKTGEDNMEIMMSLKISNV